MLKNNTVLVVVVWWTTIVSALADTCSVTLTQQLSSSSCAGKYGCFSGNNSMWVKSGCRGIFSCNGASNVVCDPCDPESSCPKSQPVQHVCKCIQGPAPSLTPLDKYLLLDDRNIITSTATLVLGDVEKHPAGPLLKEERDYEMRFDNMQPNVWYDPLIKKWRLWYSSFTSCSSPKESVPYCNNASQQCGSVTDLSKNHASRGSGFLYAESLDGITWYKPSLNMTSWKGSKSNNLIELDGMTTGVYLDLETTNVSERYKIITGSNGAGGIAVSEDGIHFSAVKDLEPDTFARWDTPKNIVWDGDRKQWIAYVRAKPTENSERIQCYTHSLTDDFMGDWTPATPTGLNTSTQYQPDGLVVWPYAGIYLGIGNVFNPTQTASPTGAAIGQVNTVLGWSADGRRWKWLRPDQSFIPLGDSGDDFDSCGVFGAKQEPLRFAEANDTLRIYYAGCNGPFFGSRSCALGLATIQRDGFAGYTNGVVTTTPFRINNDTLYISADAGVNGVKIGIVGDTTRSIDNCDTIKGKVIDFPVTWSGSRSLGGMTHGAVSFTIQIGQDATVYALSV